MPVRRVAELLTEVYECITPTGLVFMEAVGLAARGTAQQVKRLFDWTQA